MTEADQERCAEIERRLKEATPGPWAPCGDSQFPCSIKTECGTCQVIAEAFNQWESLPFAKGTAAANIALIAALPDDLRFLLDRLRTADAMLQDAFLLHGIDVKAVERAVAMKCCYICLRATRGLVGVPVYAANRIATSITAAYNLLPLEDAQ